MRDIITASLKPAEIQETTRKEISPRLKGGITSDKNMPLFDTR